MRICLIGGIYGKGGRRSEYLKVTPETTLEAGLRADGCEVTTLSHYDESDFGRFDVVHVHHLSYGAVRLASDPSNTPFVFTAHDASQMNGQLVPIMHRLALRYVLSRADAVVALSRAEADFERDRFPLADARQKVIANGIDTERFQPVRQNTAGNGVPWRILFVGQLIPFKGCDLLLEAVARLDCPVSLSLVYQTPSLEGELRLLASKLGIENRTHFLSKQEPAQLARLYQESDLLVLPSRTEALPSVITEAMLSGLPFIASRVGGIPEQAAGFGVLLEERTAECLAKAMANVFDNYSAFANTAASMSESARSRFSTYSMVEQHLALYRELAGQRARRRSWHAVPDGAIRAMVRRFGRGRRWAPRQLRVPRWSR